MKALLALGFGFLAYLIGYLYLIDLSYVWKHSPWELLVAIPAAVGCLMLSVRLAAEALHEAGERLN